MTSWLTRGRLELRRRIRYFRGEPEAVWPVPPAGVYLNPSDADFAAYAHAPLALTWTRAGGADAAAWQEKVRVKLRELMGAPPASRSPGMPLVAAIHEMPNGLRRQTYYLPSAPRRHVPLTIVWNPATANRALPLMICLQGHNSGAHISWGEIRVAIDAQRIEHGSDYALQAVHHGHVAMCIEQIAFGERREKAIGHCWDHTCVDACNRAFLLGRTLLGERVADISIAIDWLHSRPQGLPAIDLGSIYAMGNSAGGETALYAAVLDTRIAATIASGCVGAWRKTSGARMTCPDTVVPGVLGWIEYSDVVALCAPRPLLVVSGISDHIYPYALATECAEEARPVYAAMNAADRLKTVAGPAGHRFYPDLAWPVFLDLVKAKAQ
jgi:hypothetical protein